jgi:hypothetical protein
LVLLEGNVEFRKYRYKDVTEAADWAPDVDMTDVNVAFALKVTGHPSAGDKIIRESDGMMYLLPKEQFEAEFEAID